MKKIICVIMAVTMALSLAACGSKGTGTKEEAKGTQEESKKDGESVKSNESDTLYVATEAGFAPYEYMEGDKVVGIDMDIAQAIADKMGKKLEIMNMDFDGALAAVQSGKVDFAAAGISISEERKKNMDFSDEYVDSTDVVVVNKENPLVSDVSDLNDKVIGVQQGNIADIWCTNTENVKAKEVKRYTKFVQAATDLANGKIDCIVMDIYPAQEMVAANDKLSILDGEVFTDKYAIAVKKGNTELLDQINAVIKELKENGKIEEFTASHAGK